MMETMRPFLTAEWRHLAMLNWCVDPERLTAHVPRGCTLDLFDGIAYVSLVGFRFVNTRVRGLAIPGHRNFDEVNLRFYVRREVNGELRRAVTFLREFVPRRAIAWVARWRYNEPYRRVPMSSDVEHLDGTELPTHVRYAAGPMAFELATPGVGQALVPGSFESFIAEHYWGYTSQRDGGTVEYAVQHPSWRIAVAHRVRVDGPIATVYGQEWAEVLAGPVHSAWVADGSAVAVLPPVRL